MPVQRTRSTRIPLAAAHLPNPPCAQNPQMRDLIRRERPPLVRAKSFSPSTDGPSTRAPPARTKDHEDIIGKPASRPRHSRSQSSRSFTSSPSAIDTEAECSVLPTLPFAPRVRQRPFDRRVPFIIRTHDLALQPPTSLPTSAVTLSSALSSSSPPSPDLSNVTFEGAFGRFQDLSMARSWIETLPHSDAEAETSLSHSQSEAGTLSSSSSASSSYNTTPSDSFVEIDYAGCFGLGLGVHHSVYPEVMFYDGDSAEVEQLEGSEDGQMELEALIDTLSQSVGADLLELHISPAETSHLHSGLEETKPLVIPSRAASEERESVSSIASQRRFSMEDDPEVVSLLNSLMDKSRSSACPLTRPLAKPPRRTPRVKRRALMKENL